MAAASAAAGMLAAARLAAWRLIACAMRGVIGARRSGVALKNVKHQCEQ